MAKIFFWWFKNMVNKLGVDMRIYQVTPYQQSNTNYSPNSNKQTSMLKNNPVGDSVTFGSYHTVLKNMTKATLKKDSEAEKFFIELFKILEKDNNIQITEDYKLIAKEYKKSGFRGLLNNLWKAYPDKKFEPLLRKSDEDITVILLSKGNRDIMELHNLGRFGFFNSSSKPREIKISFMTRNKQYYIDFGLESNGNLTVWQRHGKNSTYTEFHQSTGNRKLQTIHSEGLNPESTYYKKDGSLDGWRNLLGGGTAVPGIF